MKLKYFSHTQKFSGVDIYFVSVTFIHLYKILKLHSQLLCKLLRLTKHPKILMPDTILAKFKLQVSLVDLFLLKENNKILTMLSR